MRFIDVEYIEPTRQALHMPKQTVKRVTKAPKAEADGEAEKRKVVKPPPPKGEPQYKARGDDAHLAMTTNERLMYFGLLEDFDRARNAGDRDGMVAALKGAKFDLRAAEGITDHSLNRSKTGARQP